MTDAKRDPAAYGLNDVVDVNFQGVIKEIKDTPNGVLYILDSAEFVDVDGNPDTRKLVPLYGSSLTKA